MEDVALLNVKLSDITDFFTCGPKREILLKKFGVNLVKFSRTRWSQRSLSWERFTESYEKLVLALRIIVGLLKMEDCQLIEPYEVEFDTTTRARARLLLETMESSTFLVGKITIELTLRNSQL